MSSKSTRQKTTKGLVPVVLLGISLAVIGALIGFVTFVLTPVQQVRQLPSEDEREARVVYYIKGIESGGATWKKKQDQFLSKQPLGITVIESELNQWSRNTFRFDEAYKQMDGEPKVKLDSPRFRIDEDTLQIATEITLTSFDKKLILLVRGTIDSESKRFIVTEMTIGSAPVPSMIANALFASIAGKFMENESMKQLTDAWASLDRAELSGKNLTLTRK